MDKSNRTQASTSFNQLKQKTLQTNFQMKHAKIDLVNPYNNQDVAHERISICNDSNLARADNTNQHLECSENIYIKKDEEPKLDNCIFKCFRLMCRKKPTKQENDTVSFDGSLKIENKIEVDHILEDIQPKECEQLKENEICGFLPAECDLIQGEEEHGSADESREICDFYYDELIQDTLVKEKRRISTIKILKWSKEEDMRLMQAVKVCQHNWAQIALKLENSKGKNDSSKSPEECKRRWISLTKGTEYNWNQESEDRLLELVATKGKNWALFTKYFDGLHKDKIKYHYDKLMKEGRFPVTMDFQRERRRK